MPPARSQRLYALELRIRVLRRHLLPAEFSLTGDYSKRQYDRARAFRLLAHAEIEACLEDLSTQTLNEAFAKWQVDRKARTCLIALLAYFEEKPDAIPEAISSSPGGTSGSPLRTRLDDARKRYVNDVARENHGIKEKNVLRMLLPLGILESDLPSAWLQTIDSFGQERGNTAHAAVTTHQPPDPEGDFDTVMDIVSGLRPIDEKLRRLRK